MDPLCPMDTLCSLNIVSIEHCVLWTSCPLGIELWTQWLPWLKKHDVQWTRCPMDPMDPMVFNGSNGHNVSIGHIMDPLDKNTKLMFTRQTRVGDCVLWIHSDGSIGHPLDPLDMSIEHRKWIQWIHCIHWTPLDNVTDGHPVQWTFIGHVHWTWWMHWTRFTTLETLLPRYTPFNTIGHVHVGSIAQYVHWIQWIQRTQWTQWIQ